ncbi:MAG: MotA/TolQ/ExbB proton channel family protein [Verrucomicrobia bacterium]|jgi:biopolymer transport protein ExbB/TolQ|nr:MotA/TolQ/ExbB proton channel family protein [Verrucomicrobiota bacterium]
MNMELHFEPFFANALQFAFDKATTEGKVTIGLLAIASMISWTVIIQKGRQLYRASKAGKRFFAAFRATRDPLELFKNQADYTGAPAFEIYHAGAEELAYQLKHNPVPVRPKPGARPDNPHEATEAIHTDLLAKSITTKISSASFDSVRVVLERAVSAQAISLERGMIILSTAVAGGPFLGLLGTVWGVMETFSGIAKVQAASLTAMAPGVAGALIATVVGLFVAIPAMFAYNYMITTIRAITQQLDNFNAELATAIEHKYVDNRSVSEEVADALRDLFPGSAARVEAQENRAARATRSERESELAVAGA